MIEPKKFEERIEEMFDLQLHAARKIAQIQAQLLIAQDLVLVLLAQHGADPAKVEAQLRDQFRRTDSELEKQLIAWLEERKIVAPRADAKPPAGTCGPEVKAFLL